MSCRRDGERGAATTALVLSTYALIICCMTLVQMGLWFHAVHVARAAAQEGARAARVEGGTEAAGYARTEAFLAEAAPRLIELDADGIRVHRDDQTASVHVSGHVIQVAPLVRLAVSGSSEGPVERFRPVTETP